MLALDSDVNGSKLFSMELQIIRITNQKLQKIDCRVLEPTRVTIQKIRCALCLQNSRILIVFHSYIYFDNISEIDILLVNILKISEIFY